MKKELKAFLVWVDDCGWDEYDAAIIVGESEESVLSKFEVDKSGCRSYEGGCKLWFDKSQGEIHIKEVDLSHPDVVLASFRAG